MARLSRSLAELKKPLRRHRCWFRLRWWRDCIASFARGKARGGAGARAPGFDRRVSDQVSGAEERVPACAAKVSARDLRPPFTTSASAPTCIVLVASGLGGGSLVNAGVSPRPDPRVFDGSVARIAADALIDEALSPQAEQWVRPMSDPTRAAEMTKYKVLEQAVKPYRHTVVAPRIAVNFDGGINAAAASSRAACTRNAATAAAAANVGAKNTVALNIPCLRRGTAWSRDLHRDHVQYVYKTASGDWRVHASSAGKSCVLEAPVVVLAAGTLGSTEILLRSRDMGLAVLDQLGERFSSTATSSPSAMACACP